MSPSRLTGGRDRGPLDPDKDSMFVRRIPVVGRLRQLEPQVPCACELVLGQLAKVEIVVTQKGHGHSLSRTAAAATRGRPLGMRLRARPAVAGCRSGPGGT